MALSIAIAILFLGGLCLSLLPREQFPDIAPPTVVVQATYPGASAEAVAKAVLQPLEESINGVENMTYMTSNATNAGTGTITVYFKQGCNPDMAAINVQNRVSMAQGLLPGEVTKIGVVTMKRQTSMLQINALVSDVPEYDQAFLGNYMSINVTPQLKRVTGVGDVMAMSADYSLRIWLKPDAMAQHKLMPADITACLAEQNLECPTGIIGEHPTQGGHGDNMDNVYQFQMKYSGRLTSVEQFKDIVIQANNDGTILRLGDVADVELGQVSYAYCGALNGKQAVVFMAFQVAGANAVETNNNLTDKLNEISQDLPKGVYFVNMMSTNDFLNESIKNIWITLFIALFLVILVVYFFLQDFKATLIPSISIIVSLIGTFVALQLAGFSLNLLTMFALVLAIGTVVDDAIVVVEAVQAKFDAGYTNPYEAVKDALSDVTMAVITCTMVFMAVFIPVTFMGGTSGAFYTQFGVTMAVAVGISCVSALCICPALCALMMRPADGNKSEKSFNGRVRAAYNASYGAMSKKYARLLKRIFNHRWVAWTSLVVVGALIVIIFKFQALPKGLVPQEDQGVIMVNVTCPPGSNLHYTMKVLDKIETMVKEMPEVQVYTRVAGYGMMGGAGTANGMLIIRLKPWAERSGNTHASSGLKLKLMLRMMKEIPEAQCFAFEPGMIPGYGQGSNLDLHIQDRSNGDKAAMFEIVQNFIEKLNARKEIQMVMTTYSRSFPQYQVEVDAAQCKRAGLSPANVLGALGSYCGGAYVSNINQFGKVYRVMLQSEPDQRMSPTDLNNMYVRSGNQMAPLSQFIKLTPVLGPEIDTRFNLFSEISLMATPASGYVVSDAMQAVDEVAAEVLPQHFTYEYGSISREENLTRNENQDLMIYGICIILIFLILSCLYESFLVPWAVILSVPAGLLGVYAFGWIWNMISTGLFIGQYLTSGDISPLSKIQNDIYLQTGVIMVIGLLAKTAILITEFALERRRKGMGIVESAYAACEARLRPILMTVLTCVLGMLPLLFASGAGANGDRTIGVAVVGGMVFGTIAILLTVPVFFIFFEYIQEKIRPAMKVEADQQFLREQALSQQRRKELEEE